MHGRAKEVNLNPKMISGLSTFVIEQKEKNMIQQRKINDQIHLKNKENRSAFKILVTDHVRWRVGVCILYMYEGGF